MQDFFHLWQLCPSEIWAWRWHSCWASRDPGGAKPAGIWTATAAGVMAPSEPFFRASCSWWSEGLFGQSFSVARPAQALRGLPCLGSFSVVWRIRHKEGLPCLGSYSVDQHVKHLKGNPGWAPTPAQCIGHLMGQPLCCSAADAGVWGERGYGDGSTRCVWLGSIALLLWLPSFPP